MSREGFLSRARPYFRIPAAASRVELQEVRSCPLCGTEEEKELFRLEDFQLFDDREGRNRVLHRIVCCSRCGFIFTNPRYTKEGFELLFAKAGQSYGCSAGRCQQQVDWLLQRIPDCSSVVDIGCGSGTFLQTLPNTITRIGLDADETTIQKLNNNTTGIVFQTVDFSSFLRIPASHVITMFHVLEHLPDPVQTLRDIRRQCDNNARLLIEVPIIDSVTDMQSRDIVGFFTIQHLSHFSTASLRAMLSRTGWEILHQDLFPDYNGYRIIAAPSDPQELLPGEPERVRDAAAAEGYLTLWRENVKRVQECLESLEQEETIVVWGAGQHTEYLDRLTDLFRRAESYLIIDSDPLKQGTTFHGIPIVSPAHIPEEFWLMGEEKFVISSHAGQEGIFQSLTERGVRPERIIRLYDEVRRY